MLKEMKEPNFPDLWKMAAFLELCPNDINDQVFLQIDEINENCAVLRKKLLGWTANKVEPSGRAPMDIGKWMTVRVRCRATSTGRGGRLGHQHRRDLL